MVSSYDFVHLSEVGSTQDEAAVRFDETDTATLVVADRQIGGRGRQGRAWAQPDRAMFSSFVFACDWPTETFGLIPLSVGVVVARAIESETATGIGLKWPNDLRRGEHKVGGILVESTGRRVIAGVGVNLAWSAPIDDAGSVLDDDPGPTVALRLAHRWATACAEVIDRGPTLWPREEYLERSVTVGRPVAWDSGAGTAVDIAPDGGLVVLTNGGSVVVRAGDVHLHGSR
ncbi:MAG: biotin--[acetyl-CoA-carboxylase] ligase [Acidimicrobiia bacterium]|nr:biotin--[acetyl-CoA-carboxylase] ligase [Acidimicrobiia bacterium]